MENPTLGCLKCKSLRISLYKKYRKEMFDKLVKTHHSKQSDKGVSTIQL